MTEIERDAARYRLIRDLYVEIIFCVDHDGGHTAVQGFGNIGDGEDGEKLDAAVDKLRARLGR